MRAAQIAALFGSVVDDVGCGLGKTLAPHCTPQTVEVGKADPYSITHLPLKRLISRSPVFACSPSCSPFPPFSAASLTTALPYRVMTAKTLDHLILVSALQACCDHA